jgi:hypothetical protein
MQVKVLFHDNIAFAGIYSGGDTPIVAFDRIYIFNVHHTNKLMIN